MTNSTKTKSISNAKINLGLQVLNKREDGYHNLHSVFVETDLADTLTFSPAEKYSLKVEGLSVPTDDSNLISKAYHLLRTQAQEASSEYSIHLKKKIPIGGGLGGGSSNAAATLIALNKLWGLDHSNTELEVLGKSLGADVPFFIKGGIQLVEGIGDILTPIDTDPLKGLVFVLVIPPFHVSTPAAYKAVNKSLQAISDRTKFAPLSKPMKWELFENDFERVIRKTYPEIGEIKEKLFQNGALFASLSGSGSTVFGVFDNRDKAEASMEKFSPYQTFLSSPVFR
ncbi:MAG: 4-(cytidine 5'-diphospho)-2-C-methyl-D-erythritol kinase [Candidatus Marinimicrobia bacterium]|jgi:4-diphosphocytidyl-2-C-methyl-D-erythritol kinase|nr:4-(cytidine 5'-diphospho)-2-C-methyl-D-erythritol kinase [Candidatus Neomarinimicrobiota bacterium]MDP6936361.1 4-(cytidine 5'-diphospho)-2-C-methyl-D-erythritol kinase [Candidatus Neomarinimicrobiota bacterium]